MDYALARQYLTDAQSYIAQVASMLSVAEAAGSSGEPVSVYVPSVGNPPTDAKDADAWFSFLSNVKVEDAPGYLVGYAQHVGVPVGQFGFLMQNSGHYPAFLTYAQLLAALIQAMPSDQNIGAQWDNTRKLWMDGEGVPYAATQVADPQWQQVFKGMGAK